MRLFSILCVGLLHLVTPLPDEYKTETRGYGNTHETVMRPRCDFPTVMAVKDMFVTSKKKSLGCPAFIQASTVYDPVCTQVQDGDCTLQFDLTKREPYLECTGNIECDVGTDWQQVLGTCGSSYMTDSHIMSMQYNCIRSADILKFNAFASKTVVTETYISNDGFPNAMTSSSGGTCFISSCSMGMAVGLIDLRLTKIGGICQQSVKVKDGGTTTVVDCDDNNSLQYRQRYMSLTSSIYVTLTVTSATPDSFAWIDVSGDRMAVYCGVTETFTPSSELDCSTTPPTTTESGSQTTGTKPASNTSKNNLPDSDASTQQGASGIAVAGLVFGLIGFIFALVAVIYSYCHFKKRHRRIELDQSNQQRTRTDQSIIPEPRPGQRATGHLQPLSQGKNENIGDTAIQSKQAWS